MDVVNALPPLDGFEFEPTGWDLAFAIGIAVDPATDAAALDVLADAMLVGLADGAELERLTTEAMDALWDDELTEGVREGLRLLRGKDDWRRAAEAALPSLDDPSSSDVCREVVRQLAMELSQVGTDLFFCLHCLEEGVSRVEAADRRRGIAVEAALAARRAIEVAPDELRGAAASPGALALLGTEARRREVRERLGRLASLGQASVPTLARELRLLADEPLPESAQNDDVWAVVARAILAEVADPTLN